MDSQGRGLIKALENWAKKSTKGYQDVDVRDMSSSFRDGLAFCAIIHKYRPDLIEFDTLSKENILENNQLAFSVAEKQLGVPALLDAEDMVKFTKPDRLSIITYLSQLHNCFENQNKVRPGFKRLQNNNISGPPSKILAAQTKLLSTRRIEVCQVCNNRVFILERLIVEGKLYHTACFRCNKCNALLNPGAYVESDSPGKYECTVCLPDEKVTNMDTDDTESIDSYEEKSYSPKLNSKPLHTVKYNSKSPLTESVTVARTSFLQGSLSPKSPNRVLLPKLNGISSNNDKLESPDENDSLTNGISVKEKISVFESTKRSNSDASKFQLTSPSKIKDSPTFKRNSYLDNSSSLSPKPSVRLSLLNSEASEKNEVSLDKVDEKKIPIIPTVIDKTDTISKSDISAALKILSPNSDSYEISNVSSDCDNTSSKLVNEAPSPVKATFSEEKSPILKTSIISSDKNKETYKRSISEYKSPLKTSRDIFKTNIQPLKLTIPTISSIAKTESSSLPGTPLFSSNDSVKSLTEIAQIRSNYDKSLSRPLSSSSILDKQKSSETSLNTLSSELRDKQNAIILRRKSLDSEKSSDCTIASLTSSSKPLRSETESKEEQSTKTIFQNNYKNETVSSPIPSVRRSLEMKKLEIKSESEKSIEKVLVSENTTIKNLKKEDEDKTLTNLLPNKCPTPTHVSAKPSLSAKDKTGKEYPDDLNPFGDDEEDQNEEYPDDLNPFGDDEEEPPKVFEGVSADNYDESKNPFASDEEESETASFGTPSPRPTMSQNNSPFGTLSSPTGSLHGTTKKRKAPQPPKMSDIFPNIKNDTPDSKKLSPAVSRKLLESPSPKLRKNKPAPPPPPGSVAKPTTHIVNGKVSSTADDLREKSSASKEPKKKKRPAPPVPIPMQKDRKKIPLKEIMREMKEIETKQREFEKQGREIELLIRDRDKDEEPSVEEEEYIMQLFELVNQKNALFRRQAELMYIKRSQRLEEQQEDLEKQIRELMSKPENEKTDEEKVREEELIYELTDIVDQRNSIIDSIEMDRRREMEEDVSVQEQIEMKNGDLPIAAEIKEKSKDKDKKEKKEKKKKDKEKKKDKHKKKDNEENGKTTLKRKLFK